jgi:hypothetical protein
LANLNMYRALDLAIRIAEPNRSYIRLFNTDFLSQAKVNYDATNLLTSGYKDDKVFEVPNTGHIEFMTYNKSCVYSWGYQIWKQGRAYKERIKGIAGKNKPFLASSTTPANNVLSSTTTLSPINSATSGLGYDSIGYQGADIIFDY